MEKRLSTEEFNNLTPEQRQKIMASTKLTKHFRGLESASLITNDSAAEYIGYVKDLTRLAEEKQAY